MSRSRRFVLPLAALCLALVALAPPLLLLLGGVSFSPGAPAPVAPVAYAAQAAAPLSQEAPPASITVSGEGIVTAQPDVVRMTMGVEVFNRSLAQAQAEASQRMNAVIDKLVSLGINRDDIQTVSFNVNPEYQYPEGGGTPTLRGFRVSNLVSVKITDVGRAGEIIDAVIAAGATTVHGLSFELNDPQAARDQARDQAMQNARHKAEQLARAAGVSVGRPLSITESELGAPPVPLQRGVAAPAAEAAPPPIEPGTLQVRVMVNVSYAIQ